MERRREVGEKREKVIARRASLLDDNYWSSLVIFYYEYERIAGLFVRVNCGNWKLSFFAHRQAEAVLLLFSIRAGGTSVYSSLDLP